MQLRSQILFAVFVTTTFLNTMHFGCNDDQLTGGGELVFDETDALLESIWTLHKITTKYGTHNPDAVVPTSQMEEITSGNKLVGKIDLNADSTISISNASDEFYFKGLNEMKWSYENKFIRFKHSYGSFSYKIIWYGNRNMKWYIESINTHTGEKSVKIIEMLAK